MKFSFAVYLLGNLLVNILILFHSMFLQFLGVLVDNRKEVRYAARKILKLVKLSNLKLFKSSIDGLLESLSIYPQVCF